MGATAVDNVALLKRSSQNASGAPDGNIHFDLATGVLGVIVDTELAFLDAPTNSIPNTLTLDNKPTLRAILELQEAERSSDETFRQYRPFVTGRFKLGKSFDFIYGRNAGADRSRIAGSGWREFTSGVGSNINRIFFEVSTLTSILDSSQVTSQLSADGTVVPFTRPGAVDEVIQVLGTTAFGDAGAGDFDTRTYLAISTQTYGQRHGRVVLSDFGVSELEGYGTLAAIGESPHPTTANYPIADVVGGSQVAPFTGLSFDNLDTGETRTGFNEADADFSLIVRNTANATLDQVIAWLDAQHAIDADMNNNQASTSAWNGMQKDQLYSFDASGVPTFIDGVDIDNLPTADKQKLSIGADNGDRKTFPFFPEVRVAIGSAAQAYASTWYQCYILDGAGASDYNTAGAVTLTDANAVSVKGTVSAAASIDFPIGFDTFNQAGITSGDDFSLLFVMGSPKGVGSVEETSVVIPITRVAVINASIDPALQSNI